MDYNKIARRLVDYKIRNGSYSLIDDEKINELAVDYFICTSYFSTEGLKSEKIEKLEKVVKMRHSENKFIRFLSRL